METKEKAIYLGNAKNMPSGKGIKGYINLTKLPKEHIQTNPKTGDKFINLAIWNSENDKFGNDYSIQLDTWKPDPNYKKSGATPSKGYSKAMKEEQGDSGLPF